MGKSPAKWIKTVLFGKKSSKSCSSSNAFIEKRTAAKASPGDLVPVVSDLSCETTDRGGVMTQREKGMTASIPYSVAVSLPAKDDAEIRRQELAATKAQATFRGYLARRAFRALKGIIRLQALIRGHLVRRQAVATLHCMRAIVKFQALARGRRVRILYPGLQVLGKSRLDEIKDNKKVEFSGADMSLESQKRATNAYIRKLIVALPTAMPLSLRYDLDESNSAWNWLERWSLLCFWEPRPQPKKIGGKSQIKLASSQTIETETGRLKRTARKGPAVVNKDNNASNSSDFEKSKRNLRKVVSHQTESMQEQSQFELERVKRNLRKVSASTAMAAEKTEVESEGPQKVSNSPAADVSEQEGFNAPMKQSDLPVTVDELSSIEAKSKPLTVDEPIDMMHETHLAEENGLGNGGKAEISPTANGEWGSKEDLSSNEQQKTRRRSLPAKQELPENVSQKTSSLPSYMAATESAKAKLRAQVSPSLSEEGNGTENGFARRHSLPSSASGKQSSLSPRTQRPLQPNGKEGKKSNKLLPSSRDDKVQPGWRR